MGQHQPREPFGQQPYQGQPAPAPPAHPRRAVSRNRMPYGVAAFHWVMILCTAGLWTPVYLSARRKRKTVTVFR